PGRLGEVVEVGESVWVWVVVGRGRGQAGDDLLVGAHHGRGDVLDQVHVAVGPAHHVGVAVCGGVEPEGLAHDVRDAFRFGLPPAPVQVLADASAGEVVASDVRQFVDGGLEPLRGAHVVADLHQHHVAADGDTVGTAQVWAARCGQLEAVPGVFDQLDGIVERAGRVVTGQQ